MSDMHLRLGTVVGQVPWPVLNLYQGNATVMIDKSAFSCMEYFEFASDTWATLLWYHTFNGFFLGKIPLIKKLDLREVVSVRGAWGTISEKNRSGAPFLLMPGLNSLETPYIEAGVGIANIFHLFRVDCMWKLTHRNGRDFAVCIGLDIDL
jgi:hypothetical protein